MTLGARDYGISTGASGWRFALSLMAAAVMLMAIVPARADTPLPQDQLFKTWTLICRKAPLAQEGDTTAAPEPYCRIYHRVRAQEDNTKVIFISTVQYLGKDRTPMMSLTLPAVANLQRGVTFQVDQSQVYKANIQVCTAQACISRFKLTDDLMKLFRNGTQASFSFGLNPQGDAKRDVPLSGFGTAVDALQKTGF